MLLKKFLGFVFGLFVIGAAAHAEVITFEFKGTVDYGYMAPAGTRFTGTFTYDTAAAGATSPGVAFYQFPGSLSAQLNGHTITTANLAVTVWDNLGTNVDDMIDIRGGQPVVDGTTLWNGSFYLRLATAAGTTKVLSSTALPTAYQVHRFNGGPTLTYGLLRDAIGNNLLQFSIESIREVKGGKPAQ